MSQEHVTVSPKSSEFRGARDSDLASKVIHLLLMELYRISYKKFVKTAVKLGQLRPQTFTFASVHNVVFWVSGMHELLIVEFSYFQRVVFSVTLTPLGLRPGVKDVHIYITQPQTKVMCFQPVRRD